jgi:hypothetical protein
MPTIVLGTAAGLFEVGREDPIAFEGRAVGAISQDGDWAIVDGREVWTRDGEWSKVAAANRWDLVCVLPRERGALVGTAEAHLQRVEGDRLETVESFERVRGREEWFTPWGGPPDVRSLAQAGADVFVNVHVGGIVRGEGTSAWRPTVDISTDVHEVITSRNTVMAACAVGFAQSDDRGETWSFDDRDLHATYARAIAATSDAIYMSVSRGPRGGDAAVYKKDRTRGASFERCDLPDLTHNIDTGCLAATDDLVAFGTRDGEVLASGDAGANWDVVASGLAEVRHLTILP